MRLLHIKQPLLSSKILHGEYWVNTIDQAWDSCIPLHVVVFKNPPPPNEWPFCVFNEFLWMPASQRQNYQHGRDKRPHENLKPKLCVDAKVTRSQPLLTTQRLKSLLPESYRIVDRFPGKVKMNWKLNVKFEQEAIRKIEWRGIWNIISWKQG